MLKKPHTSRKNDKIGSFKITKKKIRQLIKKIVGFKIADKKKIKQKCKLS